MKSSKIDIIYFGTPEISANVLKNIISSSDNLAFKGNIRFIIYMYKITKKKVRIL